MSKYKIIAIVGKSGSGKDLVLKEVLSKDKNLHEIISYTTRPPREREKDGVNYYFVNTEEFSELVINREMIEATEFNGWFYGTGYRSLREDAINIGVFNPAGVEAMAENSDVELYVFYLDVKDKTRLLRQLKREDDPDVAEIIRRYKTDNEDFYDLSFHYNELTNENKKDLRYNVAVIAAAAKRLRAKINN